MAITAKLYTNFLLSAFSKEINLAADNIKLMLCTSSYAPNQGAHRYKSSVTNEVAGTGYTAGGATLAGAAVNASGTAYSFDANDVSWTNATLTGANAPRYGVLYDATPASDATRPLIGYIDFGDNSYAPNGGTLTVSWNAAGIVTVTVA